VHALAKASEEDVLLLWEGLGYYTRARNLLMSAKIVVQQYSGSFPQSIEELRKLPGIGEYTAKAIASICFHVPVFAVDGNGKRVFARLLDIDIPMYKKEAKAKMKLFARDQITGENAGTFNQAIMDLGSLICIPQEPKCSLCPLRHLCKAYEHHTQALRPVKAKKDPLPLFQVVAAVISDGDGHYLLAKRPGGGMLPGLWEFPGGKVEKGEDDKTALLREIQEELHTSITIGDFMGSYRHAYTHFKINAHAYLCRLNGPAPTPMEAQALAWVESNQMANFAMGKVDRLISREL